MDTVKEFQEKKYTKCNNVLNKDIIDFVSQYALFDELRNPSINDGQVINAHAKYADPAMETILVLLKDKIEAITGLSLYPTYSYYRVYRNGSTLEKHIDRPSCEISATLSFNYSYQHSPWPIYMDGKKVILEPGDVAVYRGCEVEHWRNELTTGPDEWHVQGFFHYVDQNGPFSEFRFDKRNSIGSNKTQKNNKKYITII